MPSINVLDAAGAPVAVNIPNADGQATMAASRPVAIASDQSPVPVQPVGLQVVTVTNRTAVGDLFSVDASNFRTAVMQLSGTWAGTVTFEVSNDNTNWIAAIAFQPGNTGSTAPATTATANGIYVIPVAARYVRARVSTYTSGTVTGTAVLRDEPTRGLGVNVAGGSIAVSGNTLVVGAQAEDLASTSAPVIVGGVVRDNTAPTTLVAGDGARATFTRGAALVVKPYSVTEAEWNGSAALTTTTAAALVAAAGAGLKRKITALQAINTGAATVDLILLDGATERWRMPLPINVPVTFPFPTGLITTAATALNANLSATGTVRVNAQGYTEA